MRLEPSPTTARSCWWRHGTGRSIGLTMIGGVAAVLIASSCGGDKTRASSPDTTAAPTTAAPITTESRPATSPPTTLPPTTLPATTLPATTLPPTTLSPTTAPPTTLPVIYVVSAVV